MEISQKNSNMTQALSLVMRHVTTQKLLNRNMEELSRSLPTRIEDTFDEPKLRELVACTSRAHVRQFIHFELANLARNVNVGQNLTDSQAAFAAEVLEEDFPTETLADFKICFRNAAAGRYNSGSEKDIFRLDAITVRRWMTTYLEEKADKFEKHVKITEAQLKAENEAMLIAIAEHVPDPPQNAFEDRKPAPLTDADVAREGRADPAPRRSHVHDASPVEFIVLHDLKIEYGRKHTDIRTGKTLPGHPTFEEFKKSKDEN